MKAMILSAGVGSRLFPLTDQLPKPMLPVGNKPALEYLVDLCTKNGITDIKMNLHYLPEEIDSYFQDGSKFGANISYSLEKNLTGTAGAVKRAAKFLNDTFLVLSGDGYTDIDIKEMYNFHKRNNSKVTIAVKQVEDPSKFGVVVCDGNNSIAEFQEKPKKEEAKSNLVNLGIYIIEPEILDLIPAKTQYDFGYQLFPKLLELNIPFYAYETNAYWTDIGSMEEYWKLNLELVSRKKMGFDFSGFVDLSKGIYAHTSSKISKSALVNSNGPLVIGKNVVIKNGVTISGPAIIGDNVVIDKNSTIMDSVILPDTYVGKNVEIHNSVVSRNYYINIPNNFGTLVEEEKILGSVETLTFKEKISSFLTAAIDRTVALGALAVFSPIFALIALLIKLDSKGPVFYKSKRLQSPSVKLSGKNWNIFKTEKAVRYTVFRTMYTEADKRIGEHKNKYEKGPFVKVENDPRVTRVGNFLRKTSLDELPLLLNVLKGDMSLVGIWALPVYEAESLLVNGLKSIAGKYEIDLSEMARVRFLGKMGLAGYWQSRGRSNLSAEERALHDSFQAVQYHFGKRFKKVLGKYAEHFSLKGYFEMIAETFLSVVKRSGAM